jgi:ACS family glucarate transporter-like MFS transporter
MPSTPADNSPTPAAAANNAPPTHARRIVLGFALSLAVIVYLDRVCISQAAPDIRRELGLSDSQMGWVFSIFAIAYALFEVPAGWMGDRYGPRGALMKVVVLLSMFTAATGLAWNYASLLVYRFIFGIGEAGCFPNLTKVLTIWLPTADRPRAQGLLWLAARWGGAISLPLVAWATNLVNWRWAFWLFGLIGTGWAVGFYRWFRDRPRDHPAVNAAELALLDGAERNAPGAHAVPWGRLVASRTIWLLWLQYFCLSYGWYFYITWLPSYMKDALHMSKDRIAGLGTLPLFFGGIGCLIGGWLAKRLGVAWGDARKARRIVAAGGLFFAGALLVLVTKLSSPTVCIGVLALASFSNDLAIAPDWAACMDVGGRFSGSVSGSMNMMGNVGSVLGPIVVGHILDASKAAPNLPPTVEGYARAFYIAAVVYVVGAVAWLFIDPVTPLEGEKRKGWKPESGRMC